MQKNLVKSRGSRYTLRMTDATTTKTYYDKFFKERNAASELHASLAYVCGYFQRENPEIVELIEKALDKHKQDREQSPWL